jgi:hypothetical protein
VSAHWSTAELDGALRELAASFEVTPPDYAERVTAQLAERQAAPPVRANAIRRRSLLLAAAVLVALGLVGVPSTRHAIASWFSFGGVEIRYAPPTSPLPSPTEPGALDAGVPVTLQTARQETGGRLVFARGLPAPRAYLLHEGDGVAITLAYRRAPGLHPSADTGYALIVTEIFDAGRPIYEKILHTGATATSVRVNGRRGVFIAGPQELVTGNLSGNVHVIEARASANTLIWSDGAATYRVEAEVSQGGALELAKLLSSG